MNYCNANDNKEHLLKLIDLIYNEVISCGGDGDVLWYSKYYDVNEIKVLVEEYNNKLKFPFEIKNRDNLTFDWGQGQEWVTITNSKEFFDNSPDWITMKIVY